MIKLKPLSWVTFQPLARGTSSGAGVVADHASGLCCSLFNLGMNYLHATTKILLILKSCLVQNSWTQIIAVLVLKVLWDSPCASCPVAMLSKRNSRSIEVWWCAMVLSVWTWHYEWIRIILQDHKTFEIPRMPSRQLMLFIEYFL
jgi:hypothetical protein